MGLDVSLTVPKPGQYADSDSKELLELYDANITHNLNTMAEAAGIYKELWRPEEIGITKAHQLIAPLTAGLAKMKKDPDEFKKYDPPNGWGSYICFVSWIEKYIEACREYPMADVYASR